MESVLTCTIPSLVENGIFGDVEFEDIKLEDDKDIAAQFASNIAFVKLKVQCGSPEDIFQLVVKTPMSERITDTLVQFEMELMMYKEVLPALSFNRDWYPKLYYGFLNPHHPEVSVLIFHNIKYAGFRKSESSIFLNYEHISLAIKTIAKFHAASYILKHENKNKYLELTNKINKCKYTPENTSNFDLTNFISIKRGISGFNKKYGKQVLLENFLQFLKSPIQLRNQMLESEDDFRVICHGDFCNNNIMYKYDNKGKPTECALFDFQLCKYGSLSTDLAFYLCMHTDPETRERCWDDFLKIYWVTLRKNVPASIEVPDCETFLAHFATRAIYGYTICSFFLPMVLEPSLGYWRHKPLEEQILLSKNMAGESGERAIVEILSFMYHKGYVQAFLDYAKKEKVPVTEKI
ncbi:uncharacterized protein [Halyomorpha halys]|uniref:uncharacterized protein n=1 Tax=Halyomorpha halys TaxID=286706 RepID=UPI0006D4D9A8|nr:uncharacterized protein LOC106691212 [Halyomorpha halys]KAE8573475.1 EcKinase 37 [Halyomorpha halys]